MEFTVEFYALAIPAVLIIGLAKGGFGGAGVFLATPLLALAVTPGQAVALLLPLLMVVDIVTVRAFSKCWNWPNARALMAGSVLGIGAGWLLFGYADPMILKLLLGMICILFVGMRLLPATPESRPFSAARGAGLGAMSGFTSFIAHAGGPPTTMQLLSQRLDKTTYHATTALVFWWINALKLPPYIALGLFDARVLTGCLMLSPVALFGAWLGVRLHDLVPQRLFFNATYVLLGLLGVKLIHDALGGLWHG